MELQELERASAADNKRSNWVTSTFMRYSHWSPRCPVSLWKAFFLGDVPVVGIG